MNVEIDHQTITCGRCGLEVQRLYADDRAQTELNATDYVKMCTVAPEQAAFDFNCPQLQAAIEADRRRR
jgi:hypothetical protein